MKKLVTFIIIIAILVGGLIIFGNKQKSQLVKPQLINKNNKSPYPLSIDAMRQKSYPGSDIVIEETLPPGSNYDRFIASYKSDNLKIYGLLTIPQGKIPDGGWPAIIFNHGYIPPEQYVTTEKYIAYLDYFARSSYVVFKPDYRGHGKSEGEPEGAYYSPAYTTDVLNAASSIKKYKDVNPNKIGMWGHSLGGNLVLRSMVVSKDIKAGVIWAGVVGTYTELMNKWTRTMPWQPSPREAASHLRSIRTRLQQQFGTPNENPVFWKSIDPRYFIQDISGPLQIHHGSNDEQVPSLFSKSLTDDLKKTDKKVEFYEYTGGDHNLSSPNFEVAIQRSLEFFDKYLKN